MINNDQQYINVLATVNRYQQITDGYELYNGNQLVARLVVRVRNQVVTYNVINGGYEFQIPGLEVSVTDNQINFQGCNHVSIPFTLNRNGQIFFGNAISTEMFCQNDVDQYYIQSIVASVQLKQVSDGFILVDVNGFERIRFTALNN